MGQKHYLSDGIIQREEHFSLLPEIETRRKGDDRDCPDGGQARKNGILVEKTLKYRYWRHISVESIVPETFPPVALYMKRNDNYVLYKDYERQFSTKDKERLSRTNTEFLYVRTGDMEEITKYVESRLESMLDRDDLDSDTKGQALYQASINFVVDVFDEPESAVNLDRCRQLLRNLMKFLATDRNALDSIKTIIGHNYYIFSHSVQVAALNMLAHEKLFQIDPDELLDVGTGSLLHDFGMIYMSAEIFEKNDALSDIEYYKIKRHAQLGYEHFKNSGNFCDVVLNIVRYHHERYDGNGYPTALKGDAIPRSAQLSALCDVYSALSMDRPYRKGLKQSNIFEEMNDMATNGAFSTALVQPFTKLLQSRDHATRDAPLHAY